MSSMAERILIGNTMPTGRRPVDKLCQRERERGGGGGGERGDEKRGINPWPPQRKE